MKNKFPVKLMMPFYILLLVLCLVLAQGGSKVVTVMVEHSPAPVQNCIVIDAGHGGVDGGAVSCTGAPESGINLQIAHRLDDLMHLLGFKTIMLRTEDTSLHTEGSSIAQQKVSDLKNRVRIVNEVENGVLISIHQNSFSDKQYRGAQVFYASDDESAKFASQLQSAFIQTLNTQSNRKAKQAKGIYLMDHCSCRGVLIECGFLTNPEEEALLRSDEYQKQVAAVIACTTSSFLQTKNDGI